MEPKNSFAGVRLHPKQKKCAFNPNGGMTTTSLPELGAAYLLGLSLAAPPGPINVLIFNDAIKGSRLTALSIGLGAVTADAVFYAIVSIFGKLVKQLFLVQAVLYLLGTAVLVYLSVSIIRSVGTLEMSRSVAHGVGYLRGLSVGLTNPLQIGWWIAVGLSLVSLFGYYFAVGFFGGILSWVGGYVFLVDHYKSRFVRYLKLISIISAAVLLGFAALFLDKFLVAAMNL
jgi:threonine/homoserine/homoserine lactone efflux protein